MTDRELRDNFDQVVERVNRTGEPIEIERDGRVICVVRPITEHQKNQHDPNSEGDVEADPQS